MFEFLFTGLVLAATGPDPAALLQSADTPRRQFLHSTLRVRVTVPSSDGPAATAELDVLLGNDDQQLVIFRDSKNKGRKFLTAGDKSWLIVPGSRKPIPVTPNQRLLGATTFADIARVRLSQDYSGELRPGMEPCGEPAQPCRIMDVVATTRTAPYASGTLWIDGSGTLRKAIYRLASGKPAKEITYRYRAYGAESIPAGLTLTDLLLPDRPGETTLEYLHHRKSRHPAGTFDPAQQAKR